MGLSVGWGFLIVNVWLLLPESPNTVKFTMLERSTPRANISLTDYDVVFTGVDIRDPDLDASLTNVESVREGVL